MVITPAPQPLHVLIKQAAAVLEKIHGGQSLYAALPSSEKHFAPHSKGGTQDLLYNALRHYFITKAILLQWIKHQPQEPLLCLLHLSLPLLIAKKYAPHTVCSEAVNAAPKHYKGVLNAILRRFLRDGDRLYNTLFQEPALRYNLPQWWWNNLQKDYPQLCKTIASTQQQEPPLVLRVNTTRVQVAEFIATLQKEGLEPEWLGQQYQALAAAVLLKNKRAVQHIPGFAQGWFSVQDSAAQWACELLELHNGMTVLDACAAPGGKTAHILENYQVRLCAVDVIPARLQSVVENVQRLQLFNADNTQQLYLSADVTQIQPQQFAPLFDKTTPQFDRVLADIPCTASGTVRRRPDVLLVRRVEDSHNLAMRSAGVLSALWQYVKPGGMMLMATCSLWKNEGEAQAQRFAAQHDVKKSEIVPAVIPGVAHPVIGDGDGFFYARFWK